MENYSFLAHVQRYFGDIFSNEELSIDETECKLFLGYKDNLILWKSDKYKIRTFLEHYRVYVEISPLASQDPNHWFEIDLVAAYLSHTTTDEWAYNLPRGIPIQQVIDNQLQRWNKILNVHLKKVSVLFYDENFFKIVDDMRAFRKNYNK